MKFTRMAMESLFQADVTNLNSGLDLMPKSRECADGEIHTRIAPQCEKKNLFSNFEEQTGLGTFLQSRYWGDASIDGTIANIVKKMNPERSDSDINKKINSFLTGSKEKPLNKTQENDPKKTENEKENTKNENPVKRIDKQWIQILATLVDKYFDLTSDNFWKEKEVIKSLKDSVSAMTAVFGLDLFNSKFPPIDSALQVGHVVSINKQHLVFDDFICQDDIVQQGAAHLGTKFLSSFDVFHRHYIFDKNVFAENYKKDDMEEKAEEAIEQIIKSSYSMKYFARKNNTSTVGSAEFYAIIKSNGSAPTFFDNRLYDDSNGDNNSKRFVEFYLNGWKDCIETAGNNDDIEIAYVTTINGLNIQQCSFIKKLNTLKELIDFAKE